MIRLAARLAGTTIGLAVMRAGVRVAYAGLELVHLARAVWR